MDIARRDNITLVGGSLEDLGKRYDSFELSERLPAASVVKDALFVPGVDGLFDRDGRLILESRFDFTELGDRLGKKIELLQQISVTEHEWTDLSEPVLFAGSMRRGWGHFLTDEVSRLWPRLVQGRGERLFVTELSKDDWRLQLLQLAGLSLSDIVCPTGPVRLPLVVIPFPSFQPFSKIHRCHDAFHRLAAQAVLQEEGGERSDHCYVSRSRLPPSLRAIVNEAEVERRLSKDGYRIIYPETLSVAEQISVWNTSGRIVCCNGSAVHGSLFSMKPMTLAVMDRRATNRRTYMIDRLKGHEAYYLNTNRNDFSRKPKGSAAGTFIDQIVDLEVMEQYLSETGFLKRADGRDPSA